ncbi:hypothetical protein BC826DRAFT_1034585 [Russula brevipes]|nr:hypothetical protein BC826DRAFT_1034585 [Russula brevipes]
MAFLAAYGILRIKLRISIYNIVKKKGPLTTTWSLVLARASKVVKATWPPAVHHELSQLYP